MTINKVKVLEMTQREQDIRDFMLEKSSVSEIEGIPRKRICLAPQIIRDALRGKYPDIRVHHVTASQKNLECLGLIIRIPDAGNGEPLHGVRAPSTFEINEKLFENSIVETIVKRKQGHPAGSHRKPPAAIVDKTKTTLKQARELVIKVDSKIVTLGKEALAIRRKLSANEAEIALMREVKSVVTNLVATIKRKKEKPLKE